MSPVLVTVTTNERTTKKQQSRNFLVLNFVLIIVLSGGKFGAHDLVLNLVLMIALF